MSETPPALLLLGGLLFCLSVGAAAGFVLFLRKDRAGWSAACFLLAVFCLQWALRILLIP